MTEERIDMTGLRELNTKRLDQLIDNCTKSLDHHKKSIHPGMGGDKVKSKDNEAMTMGDVAEILRKDFERQGDLYEKTITQLEKRVTQLLHRSKATDSYLLAEVERQRKVINTLNTDVTTLRQDEGARIINYLKKKEIEKEKKKVQSQMAWNSGNKVRLGESHTNNHVAQPESPAQVKVVVVPSTAQRLKQLALKKLQRQAQGEEETKASKGRPEKKTQPQKRVGKADLKETVLCMPQKVRLSIKAPVASDDLGDDEEGEKNIDDEEERKSPARQGQHGEEGEEEDLREGKRFDQYSRVADDDEEKLDKAAPAEDQILVAKKRTKVSAKATTVTKKVAPPKESFNTNMTPYPESVPLSEWWGEVLRKKAEAESSGRLRQNQIF